MDETFLITGATGFVGANITRALVKDKKKVSIIVRNKRLNWRLTDITSKISVFECELQTSNLEQIVKIINPTYVFHLAAYGALASQTDFRKMIEVNVIGLANLINAVKNTQCKLFINTGSSSEYGIKNTRMNENDTLQPINNYAVSKASATLLAQKEAKINKIPLITFRLFSPYGFFEDKSRLISSVILAALKNKPIRLNNPQNVRDFLFVEDVVKAYLHATNIPIKSGEIYNIGSGKQHSVEEVVNTIITLSKSSSLLEWGAVKNQERQSEPSLWEADTSKAEKDLKWKTESTLEYGLSQTIHWFREFRGYYE